MNKKILILSTFALALSNAAFAEDTNGNDYTSATSPGIYFGAQGGMTNFHYSGSKYTLPTNSVDNYQAAGRGFLGYAFSQFISAEAGYTYFGRPKFRHDPSGNTQEFLQQGVDLVAKATLPLDYGFGFYLKGGLAWVDRGALHNNLHFFAEKGANSKITPIGALGVNYWFAPNIALDLSWAKTVGISDLPTTDFVALGFIYKINL